SFSSSSRSSSPLAVFLAVVPRVVLPARAAYWVNVRTYAAATPTSCAVLRTVTCRPGLAAGVPVVLLKLADGAPLQSSSFGMAKVLPVPRVVFEVAQPTHLSSTALACASPVTLYSSARRCMPHAWNPNHWFDGGSTYTGATW